MPKVAQYEPNQVQSQVVRQPRASGDAPAAAFGSPVTEGLSSLGKGAALMQDRFDTTAAEEALVKFERGKNDLFFNHETGYFNAQGRNAFDGASSANKSLDDLKVEFGKGLSDAARRKFDKATDAHITRGRADIMRHAQKGFQAWEIGAIEAQVENSIETGSLYWNNPDRMREQRILGEQAIRESAKLSGAGAEETNEKLQTYRSSFARSAIESAIQSSATEGRQLLDQAEDLLEPQDLRAVTKVITAKEKTEKIQLDAQKAVSVATTLVSSFDTREEVITEVNKISDEELRAKTMSQAMTQFSNKRKAEKEQAADAFELAEDHITDGGTAETFRAANPEQWDRMTSKQKRKIEVGKPVVTDWVKYSDIITMPREKLANVIPADHFHYLDDSERKTLISAVRSANGKSGSTGDTTFTTGASKQSQINNVLAQLTGKKTSSKYNDDDRVFVQGFNQRLAADIQQFEADKGGKATPAEFTDILNNFTRKVNTRGFFGGLNEEFLQTLPDEDFEEFLDTVQFDQVPDNFRQKASDALKSNNRPVTDDMIIQMYKWSLQRDRN